MHGKTLIIYQMNKQEEFKNKNQLDATYYFIVLFTGSTCFGHYYVHHQAHNYNVDYHIGHLVLGLL